MKPKRQPTTMDDLVEKKYGMAQNPIVSQLYNSIERTRRLMDAAERTDSSELRFMPLNRMHDFPDHEKYFALYDGERKAELVRSIAENGIMQPIILRAWEDKPGEYEILSGHNRKYAAMDAGLDDAPVIVKGDISDDEALAFFIETNTVQRSFAELSHSEKALIIATYYAKIAAQGKRTDLESVFLNPDEALNSNAEEDLYPMGIKRDSYETIGDEYELSRMAIARYLRVHTLPDKLKSMLDEGRFGLRAAVELSYLKPAELSELAEQLDLDKDFKLDIKQAELLRKESKLRRLTDSSLHDILSGVKKELKRKPPNRTPVVKVSKDIYNKYFADVSTETEKQAIIENLLSLRDVMLRSFGHEPTAEELEAAIGGATAS